MVPFDYLSHLVPQAPAWAVDAWSRLLDCALTHLLRCAASSSSSSSSASSKTSFSASSAFSSSSSIAESAFLEACARGLPRLGERAQRALLRQWSTKPQPPQTSQPQPSLYADDESSVDKRVKNAVSLPSLRRQCPTAFVCAALSLHLHASASSADDADDNTNDRDDDDDDDEDESMSSNVKSKPKTGAKAKLDADTAVCDAALAAALSLLRAENERQAALLAHEMAAGTQWW
jgi:hypothetical protein